MRTLQIPEAVRQRMVEEIDRIISSTSQSTIPSIYGMAAAAEVKRLQPVSSSFSEVRDTRCPCAKLPSTVLQPKLVDSVTDSINCLDDYQRTGASCLMPGA
jgi:hypothetical protein